MSWFIVKQFKCRHWGFTLPIINVEHGIEIHPFKKGHQLFAVEESKQRKSVLILFDLYHAVGWIRVY